MPGPARRTAGSVPRNVQLPKGEIFPSQIEIWKGSPDQLQGDFEETERLEQAKREERSVKGLSFRLSGGQASGSRGAVVKHAHQEPANIFRRATSLLLLLM
jgi:hypothetical protein